MRYTPYNPYTHPCRNALITVFLLGLLCYFLASSFSDANAQTSITIQPKISISQKIEMLENSVKELQEKNADLEERLNYMGDSLGTTIELVDRLEAKVGI